jgi:hypothetical protein
VFDLAEHPGRECHPDVVAGRGDLRPSEAAPAVETERLDLRPASPSQARIAQPEDLSRRFVEAGAPAPDILSDTMIRPIAPEAFWTIVLGSGHRLPLDWMSAEAVARVRVGVFDRMRRERVTTITSDVLYARARRPR